MTFTRFAKAFGSLIASIVNAERSDPGAPYIFIIQPMYLLPDI